MKMEIFRTFKSIENTEKIIFIIIKSLLNMIFFFILIFSSHNDIIKDQININNESQMTCRINYIQSFYSPKYKKLKIIYDIGVYNNRNDLMIPSELALHNEFHIYCNLNINNKIIYSLPLFYNNKYYRCIEFMNVREKINFGIRIHAKTENIDHYFPLYIFKKYQVNDSIFDYYNLNKEYIWMSQLFKNENDKIALKLKNSYFHFPICVLKRDFLYNQQIWMFGNIFNHYFCSCQSLYCFDTFTDFQKCKYLYYIYNIDINRNIFPKTDILFYDFILSQYSSDDAYPIFKSMAKQNSSVHYITAKKDIYLEHYKQKLNNSSVIFVNQDNYTMNGDFLEKYLSLILKLKYVVTNSGKLVDYIYNLFYKIEYITYISITHGVSYFKYHLFKPYDIYGTKFVDKILIPPFKIVIEMAKKFGWKDENIIKLYLPKWDNYLVDNRIDMNSDNEQTIRNNSIFVMFTWRETFDKKSISPKYFINIFNLLNDYNLNQAIKVKNTTIYFTFHHKIVEDFHFKNKSNLIYIEENKISECLKKVNLLVTDFSSVIFDIIYRQQPYVIFIPDGNETGIELNYTENYIQIINSFKNGLFPFENTYFDLNQTIQKIIYYINNDFKIDPNLIKFYNDFDIKYENNTFKFIEYLRNS